MYNKDYYNNHKEQWKNNYQKNKQIILKKRKRYYEKNKEYLKEIFAEYYKENKEKLKEKQRNYYENNKENVFKSNKRWIENNKEKSYLIKQKYYQTEKGKLSRQRIKCRRRARERNIINTLTSKEWLDILEAYNYRCAYCGVEFNCENLPTKDHVIPISRGGNNTKENVVPACKSCNCKKFNKLLSEMEMVIC